MVDAMTVAGGALWIMGLALLLAAASYADWRATVQGRARRAVLHELATCLDLGLLLFCLGWLLASGSGWERGGWALLALLVLGRALARARRFAPPSEP